MVKHKKNRMGGALGFFLLVFLAGLMVVAPTMALSESLYQRYATNSIVFYDPDGEIEEEEGEVCIEGCFEKGTRDSATVEERVWGNLRYMGFTPEQAAGLMGNIFSEGGTPTRQEDAYNLARDRGCKTQQGEEYTIYLDSNSGATHASCMHSISSSYKVGNGVAGIGLGFAQWTSHGERMGYIERLTEANLIKYFEGDAYKTYGTVGNDNELREIIESETGSDRDWVNLWCVAMRYLKDRMDAVGFTSSGESTPGGYAGWMSAEYEKCNGCGRNQPSWNARISKAEGFYQKYQDGNYDQVEEWASAARSSGGNGSSADSFSSNSVTIVGDSITVGATSAILEVLPDADIHAKVSKHMVADVSDNDSGLKIIEGLGDDLRTNVVVALGTNDGLSYENVESVVNAIGNGHNVYFVNNYDIERPDKYERNNTVFNEIAAFYNNVEIIDWKQAILNASGEPKDYVKVESGMAVHPTGEGAKLFAKIISEALSATGSMSDYCPRGNECSGLPVGGFKTTEEADKVVMAAYNKIEPRSYGVSAEGDKFLREHGVLDAIQEPGHCTYSDLEDCTAFSAWFITSYVADFPVQSAAFLTNGGGVANQLATSFTQYFEAGAKSDPKPYDVFSTTGNHTGVVLGVLDNGDIIIGEAGCGATIAFNTAKIKTPAQYAGWKFARPKGIKAGDCSNEDGAFCAETVAASQNVPAHNNVNISADTFNVDVSGVSDNYKIAWVADSHIGTNSSGEGAVADNKDTFYSMIDYINNNGFDAAVFGGDITHLYSEEMYDVVRDGLDALTVPYIYIMGNHDAGENPVDQTGYDKFKKLGVGAPSCKVLELCDGLKIVGYDFPAGAPGEDINSEQYTCVANNAGAKTILASHVPIASNISSENDRLVAISGASNILSEANIPFANYRNLINKVQNNKFAAVLSGHLHPGSAMDVKVGSNTHEFVSKAAFTGHIGVINVRGTGG